jgi:hypothetical protein
VQAQKKASITIKQTGRLHALWKTGMEHEDPPENPFLFYFCLETNVTKRWPCSWPYLALSSNESGKDLFFFFFSPEGVVEQEVQDPRKAPSAATHGKNLDTPTLLPFYKPTGGFFL